jgi:4-hydroxy-tetrahydrodipicolinate synthase
MKGSYVALVTPFDKRGNLDQKTLENLVEWHIQEGTDGIVCAATTGESPCLSSRDRKKIAEICIRTANGKIPIVVSTGTSCTTDSIAHTKTALKLGASGCLVVTPYYNKPTQEGCIAHFKEVAKVGLPVIVYHNPARAVIRLSFETIQLLSQIPHIVAIKESSYDLALVRKISPFLPVFSGDDDLTFPMMQAGAIGSIAVTANIIPSGWKQMISHALKGEWQKAEMLYERYLPLCRAMFLESNPQCVKFALSWMKKIAPVLRLPMTLPSPQTQHVIQKELLPLLPRP